MREERLTPYLSPEEIAAAVRRIAGEIGRDYRDRALLLVVVLKGSFVFAADLVRELEMPVSIEFVRAGSYRGTRSSGEVSLSLEGLRVTGRHVLVVEDIVDTGITITRLLEELEQDGPASLGVCAMFDKPSRREVDFVPDYVGLAIPDDFVVGYGMDFNEQWRHLPGLYRLEDENHTRAG